MFSKPSFISNISKKISLAYSLFVECGLNIYINDVKIKSKLPDIIDDDISY
jgi:hypothetical protein